MNELVLNGVVTICSTNAILEVANTMTKSDRYACSMYGVTTPVLLRP